METDRENAHPQDAWVSGGDYENYVGRWSRLVGREFLAWLNVPPGSAWLDVGCGTGALSETILQAAAPRAVEGIDASEGFIAFARQAVRDPRARFRQGDGRRLPVETAAYDAVVSGLALNFIPQPEQAAAEMARAARPGGTVAAYVWDYAERMQFMRHFWNAVTALDPPSAALDEGPRFPLCRPGALHDLFEQAGLHGVVTRPIDIWTVFRDFDDFWQPFTAGQGPGPAYVVSLPEEGRAALRERLRAGLPFAADGSIPLAARAWAVRGTR